jgi:hypothetical protein
MLAWSAAYCFLVGYAALSGQIPATGQEALFVLLRLACFPLGLWMNRKGRNGALLIMTGWGWTAGPLLGKAIREIWTLAHGRPVAVGPLLSWAVPVMAILGCVGLALSWTAFLRSQHDLTAG